MTRIQPGTFYNLSTGEIFMTPSRAARVFGLHFSEITNAVSRGEIQYREISGCKCVVTSEVENLIKRRGKK